MFLLWVAFCFLRAVTSDWVEIPQSSKYPRNLMNPLTTSSTESTTTEFENFTYYEDDEVDENQQDNTLSFLPFVDMVQNSLLATENKSIKKKTLFLKHLRDDLLINIEKRMQTLWLQPHRTGETREYKEEHYHMDFPSNEGALMTIGFLTFAVFLIKLVLKLIHALKAKYNTYNDNQDTGTTTTYFGRKKRAVEEANKILQWIEEYKSFR